MSDILAFVAACWSSGTLLRSVCALFIVPTAAWLAIRFVSPAIFRMTRDPEWQAPLAAMAAAVPGLLLVLLSVAAFVTGADPACRTMLAGQVLYATIVGLSAFTFLRASALATMRTHESHALVKNAGRCSGRLAEIAERANVAIRIVSDDRLVCILARVWQPVIIVSSGAIERLTESELVAAVYHERGHAKRGDQLVAFVLTFLVDLLPLPAAKLVRTYRRARELAADRHALGTVHANDLAGALLHFVRPSCPIAGTAAFDGDATIVARLDVLLRAGSVRSTSFIQRGLVLLALSGVVALGLAPSVAVLAHPVPCDMGASIHASVRS